MPEIHREDEIDLPVQLIWDYVSVIPNLMEWAPGVTEMVHAGTQERGVGARFSGTFHVAPVTLHATGEIAAWKELEQISARSITGFRVEIGFRLQPLSETRTRVTVDAAYEVPGGLAGKALGRALVPIGEVGVKHAEARLRRRLLEIATAAGYA